jgi:tryptophan synthase alpha chain
VLVVDYPPEECGRVSPLLRRNGIDPIFLLAPTSTERASRRSAARQRLRLLRLAQGRDRCGHLDIERSGRARIPRSARRRLPVGVGFGIRDARPRARRRGADAVVIGSRIIQEIEASSAGVPVRSRANGQDLRGISDSRWR